MALATRVGAAAAWDAASAGSTAREPATGPATAGTARLLIHPASPAPTLNAAVARGTRWVLALFKAGARSIGGRDMRIAIVDQQGHEHFSAIRLQADVDLRLTPGIYHVCVFSRALRRRFTVVLTRDGTVHLNLDRSAEPS